MAVTQGSSAAKAPSTVSAAGLATTAIVHALAIVFIFVPSLFPKCSSESAADEIGDKQILIEASVAYKKPDTPKQPQKRRKRKRNKKKVGISRNADKKIDPKKKEKEPKEADPSWEDFKRPTDSDEPDDPDAEEGLDTPKPGGAWDGKEYGWADENKGHPYMQEIARYMRFEIPTLEKGKGEAFACIRLGDNGQIKDTKVRKSGNTNIDRAAEEALRRLVDQRKKDKDVKPIPSELRSITTHWICFKPIS